MLNQTIDLHLNRFGVPPVIHMVQNDTGRVLRMYTLDMPIEGGETAELAIHRPDDSYYTMSCYVSGYDYYQADATQALTRPGRVECQLRVLAGGKVMSTFTFFIMVQEAVDGLPVEQLGYTIYDLMDAAQTISGSGLTEDIKQALLDCFAHVAWTDEHGQDYYDALEEALYPPANLVSISAVYTQSGTVYPTTSLDDLEEDLVVTATYSDSSTETVTTYTLSGTLSVGTSTITVTYEGKTTTFTVTVTAVPTLSSITAVYTQSGTVYDTDSLDSLKTDLVVTATYSDSSTATVPGTDYTLSGTLAEGTSTITVTYEGKTDTFTVTVTEAPPAPLHDWDFTQSLVDSVGGITAVLSHAGSTDATRDSNGLSFTEYGQCCDLGAIFAVDRVIEIDFAACSLPSNTGNHIRSFMVDTSDSAINGVVMFRDTRWTVYNSGWWSGSYSVPADSLYTYFANKTVTLSVDSTGHIEMLVDGVSIGTAGGTGFTASNLHLYLGNKDTASNGANFYNVTITGVRVYNAEV